MSLLLGPNADLPGSASVATDAHSATGHGGIASSLDPAFLARAVGIGTEMIADAALEAAGAQAPGDRRLGTNPGSTQLSVWSRLVSHLSFRSVWFRNGTWIAGRDSPFNGE